MSKLILIISNAAAMIGARKAGHMKTALKLALLFGIAPLAAGIIIFIAFALTRADWLMDAGVFTIYAGICSVTLGGVCLLVYVVSSWRREAIPRRRIVLRTGLVLALYATNFVAAGAAITGAMVISAQYKVTITNESALALEAARITGGGIDEYVGPIAPGKTVSRSFYIEHDGELVLTGMQGDDNVRKVIDGYVTNGMGADIEIVLKPDGSISLKG